MSVTQNTRRSWNRKQSLLFITSTVDSIMMLPLPTLHTHCRLESQIQEREEAWNRLEKLAVKNPQVNDTLWLLITCRSNIMLLKLHLPELKSQHCHIPPFVVHLGEAGGAAIQGHKLIEFLCVCNEQNYLLPSNCNRCAMQVNKPQGISMYQPGSSPESSSSVNSGFTVAFSCDFRDRATTFSP